MNRIEITGISRDELKALIREVILEMLRDEAEEKAAKGETGLKAEIRNYLLSVQAEIRQAKSASAGKPAADSDDTLVVKLT